MSKYIELDAKTPKSPRKRLVIKIPKKIIKQVQLHEKKPSTNSSKKDSRRKNKSDKKVNFIRTGPSKFKLSFHQEKTIFAKDPQEGHVGKLPIRNLNKIYEIVKELGKGSFGTAYLAIHKSSNQEVVIKMTNDNIQLSEGALREAEDEIMYLRQFTLKQSCHPNIVCYYDAFIDSSTIKRDSHFKCANCVNNTTTKTCKIRQVGKLCIVMEYIKGKDLFDFMGQLNEEIVWYMAHDLLEGLKAIHCKGILHNDIKTENIMFDIGSRQVRFVDFGLACFRGNACSGGTKDYIAPEIEDMYSPTIRDERADVYALGLTLAEVITNKQHNHIVNVKKYVKNRYLKNLILTMLTRDHNKRPYAPELLDYVKKYEWISSSQ